VRRHLLGVALGIAVVAAAFMPLPALVDAVTGSPAGDAELALPLGYLILAPVSNLLDALTQLSLDRALSLLVTWVVLLAAIGAARPASLARRIWRAVAGAAIPVLLAVAAVLMPRPVPRLVTSESGVAVLDFHSHTAASHDGRKGWTASRVAAWHAAQGFQAAYITDHNIPFDGSNDEVIPLLPGAEWSVYRQHIVQLGTTPLIDLTPYSRDTPGMVGLFAAMHAQGAIAIASLPEYWRNHWDDLDQFVAAGVDGFEIVNCAPKALEFPGADRRAVVTLAARHDLLVTGASDNHGWGKVTCVWNVAHEGAHGFRDNQVLARPVGLMQGDLPSWNAGYTQPWLMLRALSWPERISWLTWIALISIWRGMPRRTGQWRGFGILARELGSTKREEP
jgi:hypothetical protein